LVGPILGSMLTPLFPHEQNGKQEYCILLTYLHSASPTDFTFKLNKPDQLRGTGLLRVAQLVQKRILLFMEPEVSISSSQKSVIGQ